MNTRKKRKAKDPNYNPRRDKRRRVNANDISTPPQFQRTNNETHFIDETTGQSVEYKGSIVINYEKITHPNQENFKPSFSPVPGYRPIIITERSTNGSPIAGISPNSNTRFHRTLKMGSVDFFSNKKPNNPNPTPIRALPTDSAFYQSSSYQAIKKINSTCKENKTTVTKEMIVETKREKIRQNRSRLGPSQNKCMVETGHKEKEGSATEYLHATGLFPQKRAEWSHLLPHRIGGEKTQNAENLVVASFHANTAASFLEDNEGKLAQAYSEGYERKSRADLIPGTHVATTIHYQVDTQTGISIPFDIDAQQDEQPHKIAKNLFGKFFQAVIDADNSKTRRTLFPAENKEENNTQSKTIT